MGRIEEKKQKKAKRKIKRKQFLTIFLCIVFFLCMVNIVDNATSKMMQKSDDTHAVYAKYEDNGILRLDIAGNTFRLYVKPIIDILHTSYNNLISYFH
ncbi:MAG: hypothetical protein M0P77_00295 [Firmicutes bacterium]|nr:hypothetical protein [Bacillota bacterium]